MRRVGKATAVFENAIANQLARLGTLHYFEKSRSWEIDFILDEAAAYEARETPAPHHLNSLKYNAESIGLDTCHLVGRYPGGAGLRILSGGMFSEQKYGKNFNNVFTLAFLNTWYTN